MSTNIIANVHQQLSTDMQAPLPSGLTQTVPGISVKNGSPNSSTGQQTSTWTVNIKLLMVHQQLICGKFTCCTQTQWSKANSNHSCHSQPYQEFPGPQTNCLPLHLSSQFPNNWPCWATSKFSHIWIHCGVGSQSKDATSNTNIQTITPHAALSPPTEQDEWLTAHSQVWHTHLKFHTY